jgi:putative transposase
MVRGIEQRTIFRDNEDHEDLLTRLGIVLEETGTSCCAWALIPNHFHMVLRTGNGSISTVMRRLLTGYATSFNNRHKRHGKLFQNRYKSILCQEDTYFLELIAYIHLNPIRAKLVDTLEQLDSYEWAGHSVILGYRTRVWQDTDAVLALFGKDKEAARRRYREFVRLRIRRGRRPELTGGGLIRSMGSWEEVKQHKKTERLQSDERILGDSQFVEDVLKKAQEKLKSESPLAARGYDLKKVAERVADLTGLRTDDLFKKGRQKDLVLGRSVLCYWAVRILGMSTTEVARRLGLTQPAVSMAVKRGEQIVREKGWKLLDCQP